jgi:nucleoid DNA-binding protein
VTKRELVVDVAERLGYTQNEVADVIQGTLDTIIETLAEGNRLEIRNFGVFEIKTRDARIGRNPRTGEAVPITQKRVAIFKPGKALKLTVESDDGSDEELPKPSPAAEGEPF